MFNLNEPAKFLAFNHLEVFADYKMRGNPENGWLADSSIKVLNKSMRLVIRR